MKIINLGASGIARPVDCLFSKHEDPSLILRAYNPGSVVRACNPGTQGAKAEESQVPDHSQVHSELSSAWDMKESQKKVRKTEKITKWIEFLPCKCKN